MSTETFDTRRAAARFCAHRGDGTDENTLTSFERAVALGAEVIECDLHRTSDGVLILNHDPTIGDLIISSTSFNDLAAAYGSLTTFRAFHEALQGSVEMIVEIKQDGIAEQICSEIGDRADGVLVSSFGPEHLREVRASNPEISLGLNISPSILTGDGEFGVSLGDLRRISGSLDLDFVAVHHELLDDTKVRPASLARQVYVWTVNDEAALLRFMDRIDVSLIITDEIELALSLQKNA